MKIGLISGYDPTSSTRGGAEISFYLLAKALSSLGVEVHIITSPSIKNQQKTQVEGNITIHRVLSGLNKLTFSDGGIASVMLSSRMIKREIKSIHLKERFDLLHSCNRNSAVGTVWAAKDLRIPCVLHVRDYWPFCPTASLHRYYFDSKCGSLSPHCLYCHFQDFRRFYGDTRASAWSIYAYLQTMIRKTYAKRATCIIAISSFVKTILIKNGFDGNRIRVVSNPVEIANEAQFKHRDKDVVLFVGNISTSKGAFDVVEAVRLLNKKHKTAVELRMVGNGIEKEILCDYVKDAKMNYVKIMGKLPHSRVLEEYHNADVAVLPFKRPEPFGRVTVEAMAAGLPVVSYSTGAASEIITHGKTGFLVKLDDIGMLVDSIKTLLEDENLRKTIGDRAEKVALERYSPQKSAKNVLVVYEDILSNR